MHNAICIKWVEVQGEKRHLNGCSIHLTQDDAKKFTEDYWVGMPPEKPDEYSVPCNESLVAVPRKIYERLVENKKQGKFGIRVWEYTIKNGELLEMSQISPGNCKIMIGDNVIGYCTDIKFTTGEIKPCYEIKPCEYTTEGTIELTNCKWNKLNPDYRID